MPRLVPLSCLLALGFFFASSLPSGPSALAEESRLSEETVPLALPRPTRRPSSSLSLMRIAYRVRTGSPASQRKAGLLIRLQQETHAIPYVLGLLRMKEAEMRRGAALALGAIGLRWTGEALPPLLADPHPAVRQAALEAIGLLLPLSAIPRLLALLKEAPLPEAKLALQTLAAFDSLPSPLQSEVITSLRGLEESRKKTLGIGFSLASASVGDPQRRSRWDAFFAASPERALAALARWPGPWSRLFLLERLNAKPSLQSLIEKALLSDLSEARLPRLSSACQGKLLSASACQAITRAKAALPPPFDAIPPPFFVRPPAAQAAMLQAIHQKHPSWPERFDAITSAMLGIDYRFDALGEGPQAAIDNDPTFSLTQLDCVTFLEQAIAMSLHPSMPKAIQHTQTLRYIQGKIAYSHRRHLPMLQWIPAMIRKGIARDITSSIGRQQTQQVEKTVTLQSYQASKEGTLLAQRIGSKILPVGRFTLPYLTLSTALARYRSIPPHTILSVLRPMPSTSPFQISHQGLVVSIHGQLFFRHSTRVWGSIVDTPLLWYLQSLTRYRRPFLGVHLLQILPPPHTPQIPSPEP